ncbi:MAG TPA: abhydrolase domain-containing 18 [Acidobacteriota bacterium]
MLQRLMHYYERAELARTTNRKLRPFEWGLEWVIDHPNGEDPRIVLERSADRALADSDRFFALAGPLEPEIEGETIHFQSPLVSGDPRNDRVEARYFPAAEPRGRAVVLLPHWNSPASSYVALCKALARFGVSALRLSLPYHDGRMPEGLERADYMVSANIGRTLHAVRQAVLDTRAALSVLEQLGYRRLGIVGTSIGSCVGYLAFTHDPRVRAAVFNHVSSYFADVIWHGITTGHVREGIEGRLELESLRRCWAPISPFHFVAKLQEHYRPHRMISGRYDLTFPWELSQKVFDRYHSLGLPLDRVVLPCGHYSSGKVPFSWTIGYNVVSYLVRNL